MKRKMKMVEVHGLEGITARIIADSVTYARDGTRLTTFEIEYPRFILAELNTHKMLSKNSASSRAIPVEKLLEMIDTNPAMPVHWGQNQPGMSAREELNGRNKEAAQATWREARKIMISTTRVLTDIGLHKQVANRLCEPWQRMKTVISGTEWANFFHLRDHADAQPEFKALAGCMRAAYTQNKPHVLQAGEWHLPYVDSSLDADGNTIYSTESDGVLLIEDALKVSAACCAQVSYRTMNDTLDKAQSIYSRLIESDPKHASPVEHQGKVMQVLNHVDSDNLWEPGVTHMRRDGTLWSANFKGWIQARQLIANEAVW
jgi:thymidylate synthase ThyX